MPPITRRLALFLLLLAGFSPAAEAADPASAAPPPWRTWEPFVSQLERQLDALVQAGGAPAAAPAAAHPRFLLSGLRDLERALSRQAPGEERAALELRLATIAARLDRRDAGTSAFVTANGLHGTVTARRTGAPVEGATVTFTTTPAATARRPSPMPPAATFSAESTPGPTG